MSSPVKILIFAGSTRKGSYNKMLARAAAATAEAHGAQTRLIELNDFPLPLYDGDLEDSQGIPEAARELKRIIADHDALIIASPEYNSAYSAVLKNTLDWCSRAEPDAPAPYSGKVVAILSASPGALGGLRVLSVLRPLLSNLNMHVVPRQLALAKAHEAFDEQGAIKDARQQEALAAVVAELVRTSSRLRD